MPLHKHDCDVCVFVGTAGLTDYYACPQMGYPTVVMRVGDDPENYVSGDFMVYGDHYTGRITAEMRLKLICLMRHWRKHYRRHERMVFDRNNRKVKRNRRKAITKQIREENFAALLIDMFID